MPISFEPGDGRNAGGSQFTSRGLNYTAQLTPTGITFHFPSHDSPAGRPPFSFLTGPNSSAAARSRKDATLRMTLVGAHNSSRAEGLEGMPGKSNYIIGNDPKEWRADVPHFARVRYRNIYDGIDVVYYGSQDRLEFDFLLSPGADARRLQITFPGATRLRLTAEGNLVVKGISGEITLHSPVVYQEVSGRQEPVSGSYRIGRGGKVGIAVGPYDRSRALLVDPKLTFSSYLGGSGNEAALALTLDSAGNIFLAGQTATPAFFHSTSLRSYAGGDNDGFVAKFDSNFSLIFATYLGGSKGDTATALALDSTGNIYVAGVTESTNFPTANAFQPTMGGGDNDGFIVKLDPTGRSLLYATYLGGSGADGVVGIAVDSASNIYVAGQTGSSTLFSSSALRSYGGGDVDGFVAKINANGLSLAYGTFLGGSKSDVCVHIAIDSQGDAYAAGLTSSTNFPLQRPLQASYGGGDGDGFVAKLNPAGTAFIYSTYVGGSNSDAVVALALDQDGSAVIGGGTLSTNFPRESPLRSTFSGGSQIGDGFVAKISPDGSRYIFSTYLGGSGEDLVLSAAVDSAGNIYVAGFTNSLNFPVQDPVQKSFGGGADIGDLLISKLSRDGATLVYSSYLGGSGDDAAFAVAVDNSGNVYLAGATNSTNFPKERALQPSLGGSNDAFLVKLNDAPPTLNFPILRNAPGTFTGLAFLNLGTDPARLTISGFGNSGQLVAGQSNPATRSLPANQQFANVAPEIFRFTESSTEGWAQAQSDKNTVVAFESMGVVDGSGKIIRLDTIEAPASGSTALILTDIEFTSVYTTEIDVANLTNSANNISLELRDPAGNLAQNIFRTTLGPKGRLSRRIEEIFPSIGRPFIGYMLVRGDGEVIAAELLISDASLAALNGQIAPAASDAPSKLYSAQLGTGHQDFYQLLHLVNPTSRTAQLLVRAIAEAGTPLAIPRNITLLPGAQFTQEVGQFFGLDPNQLIAGSIAIECSITGVVGDVSFGDPKPANAYRASLPLDLQPSRFAAFGHIAVGAGFFTGFAGFNPNNATANLLIEVFRPDGSLVGSENKQMAPNSRFSLLLGLQLVPRALGTVGGYFTVKSDQPITAFALFASSDLSNLAAIPAQRLADLPAASAVPSIIVTPASLDFGSVTVGQTKDLNITIQNTGNAALSVNSASSSNARFAVILPATPFSINDGGQQIMTVRFSPTAAGSQSGTLSIASNDPAKPTVTISLGGSGVSPSSGGLKADYQFQNSLNGTVPGAPDAVQLGSNTFVSATVNGVSRTVLKFNQNDGISVATAGLIPSNTYTIAIWFSLDFVLSLRRIIDFKNATSDNGFFGLDGKLAFYDAGTVTASSADPLASRTFAQVVLTRDSSKNVAVYFNGVQQLTFLDSADLGVISSANLLRFFRDNRSSGFASSGSLVRLRLFDRALTSSEVAALDGPIVSPGGTAPAIGSVTLSRLFGVVEHRIAVSDPDGDITTLELAWFEGQTRKFIALVRSPEDANLAGVTSATVVYSVTFGAPGDTLTSVQVQATDSKGKKSAIVTKSF